MCLFSATIPDWVKDIAQEHMKEDFQVVDLAQDLSHRTARGIQHYAIECDFSDRLEALSKVRKYFLLFQTQLFSYSSLLWWKWTNHCFHIDQKRCKLSSSFG